MDNWDGTVTNLEDWSSEARSEKVSIRNKAIDQLKQEFDTRPTIVQNLLSGATRSTLIPKEIFVNVFEGLFKHANRQEQTQSQRTDNKAFNYITVIQNLIIYSNQLESNRIPASLVLDRFLSLFEEPFLVRQYGLSFLKMLHHYLTFTNHSNFHAIDKDTWKRLLDICKELPERSHEISKNITLQCVLVILEIGTSYSYLTDLLGDFIPYAELAFNAAERNNCQNEAIKISYLLCLKLSVSHRADMCLFTENISGSITGAYKTNLSDEMKSKIFNFLHLICIIHEHPETESKMQFYDKETWRDIREGYFQIVDKEIGYLTEFKYARESDQMSEAFLKFASYIFYLEIQRDDRLARGRSQDDEEEGPSTKRTKIVTPLERIFGKTLDRHKMSYNWRWFMILSEVVTMLPKKSHHLTSSDRHEVLNYLAHILESLTYENQLKSSLMLCEYLLPKQFDKESEFWQSITNVVIKSIRKSRGLFHYKILALLIEHKVVSLEVLQEIFGFILEFEINNENLIILNRILRISDFKICSEKLLDPARLISKYLNSNGGLLSLKSDKYSTVCEFIFLILNYNVKESTDFESEGKEETEFNKETNILVKNLQFKSIFIKPRFLEIAPNCSEAQVKRGMDKNALSVFDKLFKTIFYDNPEKMESKQTVRITLRQLDFTAAFLHFLNETSELNENASMLVTKLFEKIKEAFESLYAQFKAQVVEDPVEILRIIDNLRHFLCQKFTGEFRQLAKSTKWPQQTAIWLRHQLTEIKDENAILKNYPNLSMNSPELRRNYLICECLVFLAEFDEAVIGQCWLPNEINFHTNVVLALKLLKMIADQPPKEVLIKIAIRELKDLCAKYHKNQQINIKILSVLSKLMSLFKSSPASISELSFIIKAYILVCCKQKYSPKLTVVLIKFFVNFFKTSYRHRKLFPEVFDLSVDSLSMFLKSTCYEIQINSCSTLVELFDTETLFVLEKSFKSVIEYCHYCLNTFSNVDLGPIVAKMKAVTSSKTRSFDETQNHYSIAIQFLNGILQVNSSLAGHAASLIVQIYVNNDLRENLIVNNEIRNKCGQLFEHNLDYSLDTWTAKGLDLEKFPWFLTTSRSFNSFRVRHKKTIARCLLKNRVVREFEDFCLEVDLDTVSLKEEISPMLALFNISTVFSSSKLAKLQQNIQVLIPRHGIENLLKTRTIDVLQVLLDNFWDDNEFKNCFSFPYPEYKASKSDVMINEACLNACLGHISENSKGSVSLIVNLCSSKPFEALKLMNYFKNGIIKSSSEIGKLVLLFKYFRLVILVLEFIKCPSVNRPFVEEFKMLLIKDIVMFLLNILKCDKLMPKKVKLIILIQLQHYTSNSFDECQLFYKEELNNIVSRLITIAKANQCDKIAEVATGIITFFFIENSSQLRVEIESLDMFPGDINAFEKLRSRQSAYEKESIKDEIDRFLVEKQRSAENIQYLRHRIVKSYKEFVQIYQDFAQETENDTCKINPSLLHKLIDRLLQFTSSTDQSIAIEAAKCLGEIGPIDLTTAVSSQGEHQDVVIKSLSSKEFAVDYAISTIIRELRNRLHGYDAELSTVATDTLICILCQPESTKQLQEDSNLRVFHNNDFSDLKPLIFFREGKLKSQDIADCFLWNKFCHHNGQEWMSSIVDKILHILRNESLRKITETEKTFSKVLLPVLLRILLSLRDEEINKGLESGINQFFLQQNEIQSSLLNNRDIVKLMLDLVDTIRVYNLNFKRKILLEYLAISKTAQACELYPNAILYGELWAEQQKYDNFMTDYEIKASALSTIMIESYEAIDQVDAVKPFLDLDRSRYRYYMLENAWELAYLDRKTSRMLRSNQEENRTSWSFYDGSMFLCESPEAEKENYEVMWRLGDWTQLSNVKGNNITGEFERNHCLALKYWNSDDKYQALSFVDQCRQNVLSAFKGNSLDCAKNIYKFIVRFTQLQQVEDVCKKSSKLTKVFEKWRSRDLLQVNSFERNEQILSQRIAILRSANLRKVSDQSVGQELNETVLGLIKQAREEKAFNVGIYNLKLLETFELDVETKAKMILEDGHLNAITGHSELAKHLFSKLVNEDTYKDTFSKISALRLFGDFLTNNLMVDPNDILKQYFAPSEKLLNSFKEKRRTALNSGSIAEEQVRMFETTARFADTIYTQRNNYMKSAEYAEREALSRRSREELETMTKSLAGKSSQSKQDKLRYYNLKQTTILEENQLNSIIKKRETYLHLAVKLYTKSCSVSVSLHDLNVFRIISLWFTNISDSFISPYLKENLTNIPSYKFLTFLPQIAARLSHNDVNFTDTLSDVLVQCCKQHPHHSISHVLALANAYEDNASPQISSSIQKRIDNTKRILQRIQSDRQISEIVRALQMLSLALIKLANKEVKPDSVNVLPDSYPLLTLKNLHKIQLPTKELAVKVNGNYDRLIYITSWKPQFDMVGGINCPKKLYCRCSDGLTRSMLVKGNDDLRQDAVMQQVFRFMNVLLKTKKQSSKRNLSIRTYKIVPLTQMSGILEFCENTKTLGEYLVSAHKKYRPHDLPVVECRKMIADACKKTSEERLKAFTEVCAKLKPVFQYFFMENFFSPGEWLEKRTFYINSVATTSMVGYVLGIGDRHVNNILIDKTSAEVIHIDFGIAFERGKILPTPEQVPFRLTRDMVAAMGIFGVDGIFRKSCEITMQVLKENKSLINTIVEVLLYDPLFSWTMNNKKMLNVRQLQVEDLEEKNLSAARALLRVNEKLNGCDEIDRTTTETQVERLIQQAISPSNLSQMFYGWQAYL